jgi:ribosome biogenesis GTPase A
MPCVSIQWYPGHMAKARRAMAKAFPAQDVIIEVLDARMPYASSNPIVTALRKQKPCLKVLTKADLADPQMTEAWVKALESRAPVGDPARPFGRVIAITSRTDRVAEAKNRVIENCKRLVTRKVGPTRPLYAMVVGIPNVGKSTLINMLMGRKVAKVGDEPAVTKSQQHVSLPGYVELSDNPGLLWPNIDDPNVGDLLAFGGAITEAALDYESIARYGASVLLARYPQLLLARYKLKAVPSTPEELLAEIGRRRGCLRGGGIVDLHKAADVLIHEFRSGAIGRITLQSPDDVAPTVPLSVDDDCDATNDDASNDDASNDDAPNDDAPNGDASNDDAPNDDASGDDPLKIRA